MITDLSELILLGSVLLFYVLVLVFTIYGAFLAYHWFNFGTRKGVPLLALATYLLGGAVLLLALSIILGKI